VTLFRRSTSATAWLLRVSWFALPLMGGPAAVDALDRVGRAPRIVGGGLLWAVYAVGLVATLAPRPWGLTVIRTGACIALALALVATPHTSTLHAVLALVIATVLAVVASFRRTGHTFVNGAAYGDEMRFALRMPPALWLGPSPLAVAAAAAGLAAGPLLLADRRWLAGAVAVAVGFPLAAAAARSLHSLARRWVVLVPAGLVVHDPLTLTDPVLFPRDRIAYVGVAGDATTVRDGPEPDGSRLDLRLAAIGGSIEIVLTDEAPIMRTRPGRRAGGAMVSARQLLVCPSEPGGLLEMAARRGIPIRP